MRHPRVLPPTHAFFGAYVRRVARQLQVVDLSEGTRDTESVYFPRQVVLYTANDVILRCMCSEPLNNKSYRFSICVSHEYVSGLDCTAILFPVNRQLVVS